MSFSNKEWTVLNNVVNSLLDGSEIDHAVASVLPKLEYVINVRLQDALSRNLTENAEKLSAQLEKLHKLAIASAKPEEFTREQIQNMTDKELRSKYLNLVKTLRDLNNYYTKRATKIGEERAEKHAEIIEKCEQEELQLDQENTYALANIIYSKEIQDKKALIRNLTITNRLKEAERQKDELEQMECNERDEHMFKVNDQIVKSKMELKAKHEAEISAFSIQWDDQEDRLERDRRRDVDGTRRSIAIVKKALSRRHLSINEEEEELEEDVDEEEEEQMPLFEEEEEEEEQSENEVKWVPFIDEPCVQYEAEN